MYIQPETVVPNTRSKRVIKIGRQLKSPYAPTAKVVKRTDVITGQWALDKFGAIGEPLSDDHIFSNFEEWLLHDKLPTKSR